MACRFLTLHFSISGNDPDFDDYQPNRHSIWHKIKTNRERKVQKEWGEVKLGKKYLRRMARET